MMPVELGRNSRSSQFNFFDASLHMVSALRRPSFPVQALALPELTTTPRSLPDAM